MRNLHPPNMKKLLLLPLLVLVCLVADTSNRVIAMTPITLTESTLANISTRAFIQTGNNVAIGGFFVQGPKPKRVIIRALGPELTQYGVPDALANPTLELHDDTGALIASNNNWATTIIGGIITANQVHDIQASGFAPSNELESAIIADLPPGTYTAIERGVNNMTGVGLVEVYDLSGDPSSILGNISTRAFVQTGDNVMIGGFIVPGTHRKRVIIRALGPELAQYGVPNALANPTLELHDDAGALIASNNNWATTIIGGIITANQVREIQASGFAPSNELESAIIADLPPGTYTAIVRGVNNTTGVALLEANMATPTYAWTGAVDSNWSNPSNWEPNGIPQSGETAVISSGTSNSPTISNENIEGVQIALGSLDDGSPDGGSVTLGAASVNFTGGSLTVTGGDPGSSTVNARLSCQGNVSLDGLITVEAMGGSLTIDAGDGRFTLTDSPKDSPKTFVLVTQESSLFFKGRNIVTAGIIEIEGTADIDEGVTLGGSGILALDSGGYLSIEGAVQFGQQIAFADDTGLISIRNPTAFHGTLGFTPVPGARMDFPGIQAQSVGVDPLGKLLRLYSGPNHTGAILAHVNVQTIGSEFLNPTHPPTVPLLTGSDFALSSDGKGGTLVTYLPQGITYLRQSMPVPLIALTGSKVSLQTIFSQSFGTPIPGFYSITLLRPKHPKPSKTDHKYWSKRVTPAWFVNGKRMTSKKHKVRHRDNVELRVGNNISSPAEFNARVTQATSGPEAEIVTYSVWTVDPKVAKGVESTPGKPKPADIVASAQSLNSTFPGVPNTNLCNWIADDVAAAAGTAMPLPDAQLDPTDNVPGGFWRFAYRGIGPHPVKNWFKLVMPGDIVRMQWLSGSGHSTSVLSSENADRTITVYDNGDHHHIGIHDARYQNGTNPAGITIYRLDPKQQYLILGSSLGEVIQGSVYNNLIRPGGGADVIIAGPNNNEIKDKTSNLNGTTVTNFHSGDILNFTDLDPNGTTAQYDATTGLLIVSNHDRQVATITMPGLNAHAQFLVTSNHDGGSIIRLLG
jgi:hypothetical protein